MNGLKSGKDKALVAWVSDSKNALVTSLVRRENGFEQILTVR
ncbi:MAG: hypothetical protein NVS1B10_08480 [Candidatus Saccharimonadales bacterium]